MKKMFVILALAAFLAGTSGFAFSFTFDDGYFSISLEASSNSKESNGRGEPAPNSHDSIPDGSGWTEDAGDGSGPAPCSGDGISSGYPWVLDPDNCPGE